MRRSSLPDGGLCTFPIPKATIGYKYVPLQGAFVMDDI